tara:strand:+ start:390 stop:584 length:195 start_codon:yes stop_codon:yes gene_type:complete
MYLDETILQSRTAVKLVRVLDEVFNWVEPVDEEEFGSEEYEKLKKDVELIKHLSAKAVRKRSFK